MQDLRGIVVTEDLIQAFQKNQLTWASLQKTLLIHMDQQHGIVSKFSDHPITHGGVQLSIPMLMRDTRPSLAIKDRIPNDHPILLIDNLLLRCLNIAWHIEHTLQHKGLLESSQKPRTLFINLMAHLMSHPVAVISQAAINDLEERFNCGCVDVLLENQLCTTEDAAQTLLQHRFLASTLAPAFGQVTLLDLTNFAILEEICYPITEKTYDQQNLLASDKCDAFSLGVTRTNIAASSNIQLQDRRLPAYCNNTHLQTAKNAWIVENNVYFAGKPVEKFCYITSASLVPLVDKSRIRDIDDVARENIKQLIDQAKKFGLKPKLHLLILDSHHRNPRENHQVENIIVDYTRRAADSMRAPCSYYPLYDSVTNSACVIDPNLDKRLVTSRGDRATHAAHLCKSASTNSLTPVILSRHGQTRALVVAEVYSEIKLMDIYKSRNLSITRQELEQCRAKGLSIPMLATLAAPGSFGLKSEAKPSNLFSANTHALLFCDSTAKTNTVILIGKKSFDTNKVTPANILASLSKTTKASPSSPGFSKSTPTSPRSTRAGSILLGSRRGSVLRANQDRQGTPISSPEDATTPRKESAVVSTTTPVAKQRPTPSISAPTSPRVNRALSVSPGSHRKRTPVSSATTSPRAETVTVEEVYFPETLSDPKKPAVPETLDRDSDDEIVIAARPGKQKVVNSTSLGFGAPPSSPAVTKARAATTASVRKLPERPVVAPAASVSPPLSPSRANRPRTTTIGKDLRSLQSPGHTPPPIRLEVLVDDEESTKTVDLTEVLKSVEGIIAERMTAEFEAPTVAADPVSQVVETVVEASENKGVEFSVTDAPVPVPSSASPLRVSPRALQALTVAEQRNNLEAGVDPVEEDQFSTEIEISPALVTLLEDEKNSVVDDTPSARSDSATQSLRSTEVIVSPSVPETISPSVIQSTPAAASLPASPPKVRAKFPSSPPSVYAPKSPKKEAQVSTPAKADAEKAINPVDTTARPGVKAASRPTSPPLSPSRVRATSGKYPASPPRSPSMSKKPSTVTAAQEPVLTPATVSVDPVIEVTATKNAVVPVQTVDTPIKPAVPPLDIRRAAAQRLSSSNPVSPRSARSEQSPKAGDHRTHSPVIKYSQLTMETDLEASTFTPAPEAALTFSSSNPVSPKSARPARGTYSPRLGTHRRDLNDFDPSIMSTEFTAEIELPPAVTVAQGEIPVSSDSGTIDHHEGFQTTLTTDAMTLPPVVTVQDPVVTLESPVAPVVRNFSRKSSPRIGTSRNPFEAGLSDFDPEFSDDAVSKTLETTDLNALLGDLKETLPPAVVVKNNGSVVLDNIPRPLLPRSDEGQCVDAAKKRDLQISAVIVPLKNAEKQDPPIPETFTSVKVKVNDFIKKNPNGIFTPSLTIITRDIKETDINALEVLKDLDLVVNDPENTHFPIKRLITHAEAMHKQHNRSKRILAIILLIIGIAMIATGISLGAFPIAQLTLQETVWTSFNIYANLEAMRIASAVIGGVGLIVTAVSATLFYRSRLQAVPKELKQISALAEGEIKKLSDAKADDDFGDVFAEPNKGFI